MRYTNGIIRPFALVLAGFLLAALLIPAATRLSSAGQQNLTLVPGDQATINCATSLSGQVQGQQSMVKCAPGTATATATTGAGPTVTGFSGVQAGQAIKGTAAIEALVAGQNIAQVAFKLDGPQTATYTDKSAPYFFMGDQNGKPTGWDTTRLPDGQYMLTATATTDGSQSHSLMVHFVITNGSLPNAPPPQPSATSAPSPSPTGGTGGFLETFDGQPNNPQPWKPANWDVTVHSRDIDTWDTLEPMHAMHGPDCGAPPATHDISSYDDAVFLCRDHVMTAINTSGYGVIYLTPSQMVDFSTGEAVIRFDLSTLRTSQRDWVDLWITPYQDNLQLPLEDWLPDLSGEPRNAVHIKMDTTDGDTMFRTSIIRNFNEEEVPDQQWSVGYGSFLTPDAKRRDTFEVRISRTHIKFGMPAYNFVWVDADIPDLGWSAGVVQFGHHSYNPSKSDGCGDICTPNTWHWDNISINPAVPFSILRADRRTVDATIGGAISFAKPAPANAHLRFAGIGRNLAVSFDNGASWQAAVLQAQERNVEEHFKSYWMPIRAGATSVQFRGADWYGGPWRARDISIWAASGQ